MFCSLAMQNYFLETRRGRLVSMKTREEEKEWREGKRGKGVTLAGGTLNQKVRRGLWTRQSEDGAPLRVKDDTHRVDLSAEARGRSQQVTQRHHFVLSPGSSGDCLRRLPTLAASTFAPSWHNFTPSISTQRFVDLHTSAFTRLCFFWVS